MNGENKIYEGQEQLADRKSYQPLDEPMVRDTSVRVKQDALTMPNAIPNAPRISVFYTLSQKFTNRHWSADQSYRDAMASQKAYQFIESTSDPENAFLLLTFTRISHRKKALL